MCSSGYVSCHGSTKAQARFRCRSNLIFTFSGSGSWRCGCRCSCSGAVVLVRAVSALAFSITAILLRNTASADALESVLRTNCKRTLT